MRNPRKRVPRAFPPVFIALVGTVFLANIASKPGFELFSAIDIVRLIGVGMCFGASVAMLVMMFSGGHDSN